MITTSVRLTPEFYNTATQNGISFSEALRVGLSLMFAERGIQEYDNKLNIHRKLMILQSELQKASEKIAELEGNNGN